MALSAGSACSSGKVGPSHVLKAMGYGDNHGALRVSIGHATSAEDIELFARALAGIAARGANGDRSRLKAAGEFGPLGLVRVRAFAVAG